MFSKKEDVQYSKVTTLIGEGCQLEGLLQASGTVRIDGEFKGDIIVKGSIFIGEKGKVLGNITVDSMLISGEVKGNIKANNQLRIATGGRVYGDVHVKIFILDENAFFEGNCKVLKGNSEKALDME